MASTEPTLNLTYDELLEKTKAMIRMMSGHASNPPGAFDRGLSSGVIHLWRRLAVEMDWRGWDFLQDYKELRLLAGLPADDTDNEEPLADAR